MYDKIIAIPSNDIFAGKAKKVVIKSMELRRFVELNKQLLSRYHETLNVAKILQYNGDLITKYLITGNITVVITAN